MQKTKIKSRTYESKSRIIPPSAGCRYFEFRLSDFDFSKGYAALTLMIVTLAVSLAVVGGFTFFSLKEAGIGRNFRKSVEARVIADGGIEDALYRVLTNKQIAGSETLGAGTATATIITTKSGNTTVIRSEGERDNFQKNMEARIDTLTTGTNFFYGVQVGDGGLSMNNGAVVNGNVYSNGSINGGTITGSATVAGGITTNPQLEWPTHDSDQFFATTSASRDIAQSFTANAAGTLNKVSVYLAKVGSPSQNLTLRIATDASGVPNRSGGIASATIAPSSVGTNAGWIDVSFSSAPTLSSGANYWIVLDYGTNSSANYWNWRKDSTDGYAGNTGKYTSDWSAGSAVWKPAGGDLAFRVWIGGVNTQIANATIGVAGHANVFVDDTIGGSDCPNPNCIVENPPRQEMPIPESVIQDWRDDAAAGGTCAPPMCDASGNLNVSGGTMVAAGPLKIPGNLRLSNGARLRVTGTLWVVGDIDLSNNCIVELDSGYGALSGIVLADGTVDVSNNCAFSGSGAAGSYIMLLDAKNAPASHVMDISNNSSGVIYYAANGRIHLSNNAGAKEVTGYGVDLDNNATITYESGLASLQFSSGPSGGYQVKYWRETK